jgi:glycosyltransferase involved in cell wall biosynthesis
MRILFIMAAFPPFPGGGERYARSLAVNLGQRGHTVTVLTSAAQVERDLWQGCGQQVTWFMDEGIEVIRCPIRGIPAGWPGLLVWRKLMVMISLLPGNQSAVLKQLCRLIPPIQNLPQALKQLAGHYDLVHGFNISWEYPLMAGRQWARERYLPFVVTPFVHFGTGKDRVARNSTMDHQLQLLREAAGIFALTSVEQEGLRQYSVNSERVAVVGSGLDPLPETADFILLQQQYHLSRPFVIFIGRNSYEKGAIHAAQAVLAMRQQGSPIALVLVGQMTAEFERFYGRLTEREKGIIRPLGILSEPDKHTLLSQAELLLLPSRTDSFGIVLLEAWAHNKAVIGARAGGIPGVVDDGQNGLLVPFGDVLALAQAIHRLLHTPDLKQAMGQQGQTKITAEYTWDRVTDRVESHYQQLLTITAH